MGFQEEDRKVREGLERQSPSASRRNFFDILNDGERQRMTAEQPGLEAIQRVRKRQYGVHEAPSGFNFQSSERDPVDFRFEWADGAPKLNAGRIADAEGRLRSADRRARDNWASGRVEAVDTSWMLREARRLLEAVRDREYGRTAV